MIILFVTCVDPSSPPHLCKVRDIVPLSSHCGAAHGYNVLNAVSTTCKQSYPIMFYRHQTKLNNKRHNVVRAVYSNITIICKYTIINVHSTYCQC